ncbi:MAG TPA: carbohydrate kinase family protein [Candidatus Portnoybacteria bacterium]|nr:carbohydrate kinase family protein [Candidatus Portnoybacteria bacterium]
MFDVITIGGATRDIIFITEQGRILKTPQDPTCQEMLAFEHGAKIKSKEIYFTLGGGAANLAIGLARLGLEVAACLNLGQDTDGLSIWGNLEKEKVNTALISQRGSLRTAFSFIVIDEKSKEHIIFAYPGVNDNLKIERKKERLGETSWIYLTSLSGQWPDVLSDLGQVVKKNKIKLAFNPGGAQIKKGRPGLEKILKLTTLLVLNKDEAIELVMSGAKKNIQKTPELIKKILTWGPEIVVVTEGAKGATVGQKKNIYQASARPGKRVDTIGAGDAFGSGFLSGLIKNKGEVKQALKYAICNSSQVTKYYGAQEGLLKKKEIKKMINQVKVKIIK